MHPPVNLHSRFLKADCFRRAQLTISGLFQNPTTSRCFRANIKLDSNTWAGVLRLTEDLERFSVKPGVVSQLIELSAGKVSNQDAEAVIFDEWNLEDCPRHTGLYEFFNVMWVEWKNRITYRKAVGRVSRELWTNIAVEDTNLVLG